MIAATVAAAAVGFTMPAPAPRLSCARAAVAPQMSMVPDAASSVLLADILSDDVFGVNPVFLLLGALPIVAGGALTLVNFSEKKLAAVRSDPANAPRLGYTAVEVAGMEELARLRYEADLKDFNAACAEAESLGLPKPNGLTWLADKQNVKNDYFGDGKNERPTMI